MATITSDNHGLRLMVRYAVLGLIAIIFVVPRVFMLISSLKPDAQLFADTSSLKVFLPVRDISFDNCTVAFKRAPVGLFILNPVSVTGVTVVLWLMVCPSAAFVFVFVTWKGRDLILSIILATLIVPFATIAILILLIASKLPWIGLHGLTWGWLNSYHVLIVPFIASIAPPGSRAKPFSLHSGPFHTCTNIPEVRGLAPGYRRRKPHHGHRTRRKMDMGQLVGQGWRHVPRLLPASFHQPDRPRPAPPERDARPRRFEGCYTNGPVI